MRNLVLLIALVFLIACAWLLFQGVESAPGGPAGLEASRDVQGITPLNAGDLPGVVQEDVPEPTVAKSGRSAVQEPSDGAPDIAAAPVQKVTGRVIDGMGNPVAAAVVFLARGGQSKLEHLLGAGADGAWDGPVQTDGQGRFELLSDKRGRVRLRVRKDGYAPLNETREASGEELAQVGDLVLETGVRLSGHVLDRAGNGLAGVAIYRDETNSGNLVITVRGSSGQALVTTGPGGEFEIKQMAAGPFLLRINHPDHPELNVSGTIPRSGDALTGQRYVLEEGHQIAGVVRELGEGEHGEFVVRASPDTGMDHSADPMRVYGDTRFASIASNGLFELRGLREGAFRLQLVRANTQAQLFSRAQSSTVLANSGDGDVELALRAPMGVTFRVVDAKTGEPCTQYDVGVGTDWFKHIERGGSEDALREDGRTTIEDVEVRGAAMTTDLEITAQGYSTLVKKNVLLMPGVVKDIGVLRIEPVPILLVQVLDVRTGEPIKGAQVALSEMPANLSEGERQMSFSLGGMGRGSGTASTQAKSDEAGMARVPSLPGKRCRLRVTHASHADLIMDNVDPSPISSEPLVIHMGQGGTVMVTVLDAQGAPAAGMRVKRSMVGGAGEREPDSGSKKTAKSGSVAFKHLAVGTHRFEIAGDHPVGIFLEGDLPAELLGEEPEANVGQEEVVISEGAKLEITLHKKPEGSVTGVVFEAGAPLAGASLSFENASKASNPMMGLMGLGGGQSARTNGAGEFSKVGLEVGTYTVTITHANRSMPMEFELIVYAGENKADYELPLAVLEGHVTNLAGEPVAGALVTPKRFRKPNSGGTTTRMVVSMVTTDRGGGAISISSNGGPAGVRTDEEGYYELRGVLSDVELLVECTANAHQKASSEPVTVGGNETLSNVDLELLEAGNMHVTVLGPDGSPAGFCLLSFKYVGDEKPQPELQAEVTNQDGMATAKGLRPGFWRVSGKSLGGSSEDQKTTETAEVEVLVGETAEVTLELD